MKREWWIVGTCCPIAFESKERAEKFLPLGQRIIHVIEAEENAPKTNIAVDSRDCAE